MDYLLFRTCKKGNIWHPKLFDDVTGRLIHMINLIVIFKFSPLEDVKVQHMHVDLLASASIVLGWSISVNSIHVDLLTIKTKEIYSNFVDIVLYYLNHLSCFTVLTSIEESVRTVCFIIVYIYLND